MEETVFDKDIVVLDCTLRDGGYYNSWDFDPKIVSRYLQSMSAAEVDVIEIGFRFPPQNRFLGAFAYSADHFLRKLSLPSNCLIAVMTNAKDFLGYDGGPEKAITDLFDDAANSPLDIVRVCSYLEGLEECEIIAKKLKEMGYKVCFNLMQIGGKTDEQITQATKTISSWDSVDVLYFADSLGAMNIADIKKTISVIKTEWKGSLGIHAHDNKGQALANSLAAIENGVDWVDGTVLGMGRGAGNARTEHLLVELEQQGITKYDPLSVFTIVMEDFRELHKKYSWGHNLLYYLSASHGIHPTYIQEMMGSLHYGTHQMLEGLKTLKGWGANAYNRDRLREAMLGDTDSTEGKWSAKNWLKGKDVLLLAAGPKGKAHIPAIIDYIDRHKPYVISLNADTDLPSEKIDAYAVCHYTRLLTELDKYAGYDSPVLMPYGLLPEGIKEKASKLSILDYGIRVKHNTFEIGEKKCTIPGFLVAPYAISAVTVGGANEILLCGFDGYGPGDPRQEEMVEVMKLYHALDISVSLIAITPSTYDVEQSSVYSMQKDKNET